jgi:hypothetical protein
MISRLLESTPLVTRAHLTGCRKSIDGNPNQEADSKSYLSLHYQAIIGRRQRGSHHDQPIQYPNPLGLH